MKCSVGKRAKIFRRFWAPKDELAGKQLCTYNLLQGLVILKMNITLSKIFFTLRQFANMQARRKLEYSTTIFSSF